MDQQQDNNAELKGIGFSNLFGMLAIAGGKYLERIVHDGTGTLILSEFVIVPTIMGFIMAWYWRNLGLPSRNMLLKCCTNTVIAIVLSFIFLGEGSVCLLIVSPLVWSFMTIGAFGGRVMFKRNDQNLNVSVISLLIVVFIADSLSTHHYENMVSDEIVINAPPSEVWKHVVSFKPIQQKNKFWLFRIGMPSPMATTVTGNYKGAGRKCIFSNGYVFGEKIVTYEPEKDLTFDIIDQPRDPEIMGHIDILRGQFLLKDNGNGTTTLIGNSWYKLYVFPVLYYDRWAQSITRNVHFRVMEHIKELSEVPALAANR